MNMYSIVMISITSLIYLSIQYTEISVFVDVLAMKAAVEISVMVL